MKKNDRFCAKCGTQISIKGFCPSCQPNKTLISARISGVIMSITSLIVLLGSITALGVVGYYLFTVFNDINNQLAALIMGIIFIILFLLVLTIVIFTCFFAFTALVFGISLITIGDAHTFYNRRIYITVITIFNYLITFILTLIACLSWQDQQTYNNSYVLFFIGASIFFLSAFLLTFDLVRIKKIVKINHLK